MRIFLAIFGTVLACLGYEIYLRSVNYLPLSPQTRASILSFPQAYHFNPVLGWDLTPGTQSFAPVSPQAHATRARLLASGERATSPVAASPSAKLAPQVIFLGDSFTFGDGLNDQETYPWVLQLKAPQLAVHNFAVPGYGTCQVYLKLKELLRSAQVPVGAKIIYGFSEFHETRNIPDRLTAWHFSTVSSTGEYFAPSCRLNSNGELEVSAPQSYKVQTPWLSGYLSLGRRLMHAYFVLRDLETHSSRRPISLALLKGLNQTAQDQGAELIVFLQRFSPAAKVEYLKFLDTSGISFIDGDHPLQLSPEMQIAGDGHPNAEMNKYWGELLARELSGRNFH